MAEENDRQIDDGQTDLNLSAIIKVLDSTTPASDNLDSDVQSTFDPNATINYQQAGLSYPELPFANEVNDVFTDQETSKEEVARSRQQKNNKHEKLSGTQRAGTPSAPTSRTSKRTPFGDDTTPDDAPSTRRSAASTAVSRLKSRASGSPGTRTRTAQDTSAKDSYSNAASSYRPVNTKKPSYNIRGGGHAQKFDDRSPIFLGIIAILAVAGIIIFVVAFNNISGSLSQGSSGYEFNLTTDETREAIDSRLPILTNFVELSIEDTISTISGYGQFVYSNERYQPDSPDSGAIGSEMISMPQETSAEEMTGYFEGGYNAYSPEELVEYFNGMYAFDMARGDLGSWNKLRYVNLHTTSIDDEMNHLAGLQDLTGDSVTISDQGVDSRGNKVIQGQKVVDGEKVLYFKIAACSFNDIYNAQTLSANSVYITCTVATYDFFAGSDTITSE